MTNPYAPGTADFLEYNVWQQGLLQGGLERDFLRAFHSQAGVVALKACVQSATGVPTRVTSMWIDRYPVVYPSPPSTSHPRELADLAIVVRAQNISGSFRQRMLLFQGKVDTPSWKSSGSSPKEIDFLEKAPPFKLYTSAQKGKTYLGSFDLQADFSAPPYPWLPFWCYLMFAPPSASSAIGIPSHAYALWPSTAVVQQPFFSCVVNQTAACLGTLPVPAGSTASHPPWGANVDNATACTEWRRLYLTLALHVHNKAAATLPGGAWKNVAPFGVSLPAFPVSVINPGGTVGFASTGFASISGSDPSYAEALAMARAFRTDEIGSDLRQDVFDALTLGAGADMPAVSTGPDGDDPEDTAVGDGENGPGFSMVFVDTFLPDSVER